MKGDTFQTKHFGTYVEHTDREDPAEEFTGVVRIQMNQRTGKSITHLYLDRADGSDKPFRYELPAFMKKYDKQHVALLGRKYAKVCGQKTFHKIIVIAVKQLDSNSQSSNDQEKISN